MAIISLIIVCMVSLTSSSTIVVKTPAGKSEDINHKGKVVGPVHYQGNVMEQQTTPATIEHKPHFRGEPQRSQMRVEGPVYYQPVDHENPSERPKSQMHPLRYSAHSNDNHFYRRQPNEAAPPNNHRSQRPKSEKREEPMPRRRPPPIRQLPPRQPPPPPQNQKPRKIHETLDNCHQIEEKCVKNCKRKFYASRHFHKSKKRYSYRVAKDGAVIDGDFFRFKLNSKSNLSCERKCYEEKSCYALRKKANKKIFQICSKLNLFCRRDYCPQHPNQNHQNCILACSGSLCTNLTEQAIKIRNRFFLLSKNFEGIKSGRSPIANVNVGVPDNLDQISLNKSYPVLKGKKKLNKQKKVIKPKPKAIAPRQMAPKGFERRYKQLQSGKNDKGKTRLASSEALSDLGTSKLRPVGVSQPGYSQQHHVDSMLRSVAQDPYDYNDEIEDAEEREHSFDRKQVERQYKAQYELLEDQYVNNVN